MITQEIRVQREIGNIATMATKEQNDEDGIPKDNNRGIQMER